MVCSERREHAGQERSSVCIPQGGAEWSHRTRGRLAAWVPTRRRRGAEGGRPRILSEQRLCQLSSLAAGRNQIVCNPQPWQ